MVKHLCCAIGGSLVLSSLLSAQIIHVPAEAVTIQIAIQKAEPFDTIIVAPGTYFEAINYSGKVIAIQSADPNDPATVVKTIIDAGGLGTVVTFAGPEGDAHSTLNGFTISGGALGINGNGTFASIRNCVIRDNTAIGIHNVQGRITNCEVINNAAAGMDDCNGVISQCRIDGNLLGLQRCNGTIRDCKILNSRLAPSGTANGSGLHSCAGTIERCLISRNARNGLQSCDATIRQSIISGNGADGLSRCDGSHIENSAIAGNQGNGIVNSSLDVRHCTIWGNRSYGFVGHRAGLIEHCIIWANQAGALQDSSTPIHSGTIDPFFIQPGHWDTVTDVWIEGDYRVAPDSPYIDAGDPFFGQHPDDPDEDLYGNVRVAGARVDIGAYEFQAICEGNDFDGDGQPDICDRDMDDDGVTNTLDPCDFTELGLPVDDQGRPIGDLNLDCAVDLRDFARWQLSMTGPPLMQRPQ